MSEQDELLYLAGVYFDPLLSDVDVLEQRLHSLAPDTELIDCFEEALDLMHRATLFWLDEEEEFDHFPDEAAPTCIAVQRHIEAIFQESEFQDRNALADTIRRSIWGDVQASDSQLVASYALILVVEGLQAVCDWLVDLRREALMAAPSVEKDKYRDLHRDKMDEARRELHYQEVQARLTLSDYMGRAELALFIAELHRQAENLSQTPDGYKIADRLHNAIEMASISARARAGGRGNSKPESARQRNAAQTRERIRKAAERKIKVQPDISRKDLVSVLVAQGITTRPTINKHLDALGILIEEK